MNIQQDLAVYFIIFFLKLVYVLEYVKENTENRIFAVNCYVTCKTMTKILSVLYIFAIHQKLAQYYKLAIFQ